MGKLNMVRVDYRMVHGQIVAKWIVCPVDRLILADDRLVDDPFMGDIYRMANGIARLILSSWGMCRQRLTEKMIPCC